MTQVADAIRKVTAVMQRRYDEGERSAAIDLHDLVEVLLTIADELDPPLVDARGCEFCRADFNRTDDELTCPYCHTVWNTGHENED